MPIICTELEGKSSANGWNIHRNRTLCHVLHIPSSHSLGKPTWVFVGGKASWRHVVGFTFRCGWDRCFEEESTEYAAGSQLGPGAIEKWKWRFPRQQCERDFRIKLWWSFFLGIKPWQTYLKFQDRSPQNDGINHWIRSSLLLFYWFLYWSSTATYCLGLFSPPRFITLWNWALWSLLCEIQGSRWPWNAQGPSNFDQQKEKHGDRKPKKCLLCPLFLVEHLETCLNML